MTQHNADLDTLEALIDRLTLATTLDLLAEVCSTKADHIRETWQDQQLADAWENNVSRLLAMATKING